MSAGHTPEITPIPGWVGYAASRDGRIWSVAADWRGYGTRELKQDMDRDLYPCVRLTVGNATRKRFKVHRLIAETFHGPRPSPEHEVRHLDGDRANSRADNLSWGTRKDNADDRERHGRTSRGARHGVAIKRGLLTSPHPNHIKWRQTNV